MTALREKASFMRLFALVAVLALVATACGGDTAGPSGSAAPEGSAPAGTDAPEGSAPTGPGGELGTYTLGVFEDMTTDNIWAYLSPCCLSVWNGYILGHTFDAAYSIAMPGIELHPHLADGELQPATQDGDVWIGEFNLKDDGLWSDGEPITAEDVAFTWQTAVDLAIPGTWETYTSPELITSVEAIDDLTVRVTFNAQPGLANWGPGSDGPHQMPIMPQHFWAPVVEEAMAADDPAAELLAASGAEAPAAGATVFGERQEGSFTSTTRNENFHDEGKEETSGGVTFTKGPYADNFQFPLYGGQEAAVLALGNGEVDLLLNPLGMQRGFQDQVSENPDLTAIVNPTNGYRFMAFNHSRAPMSDPAFRDALTILIDKEFVTGNLLQGVAFPLYVILPEGNVSWYNAEVAAELTEAGGAGMATEDRQSEAIALLTEAGYTWEVAPGFVDPESEEEEPEVVPTFSEGLAFSAGEGLIGPDGVAIEQLELVHPTASYDPLRATFGGYISGVAQEMGIPLVSVPTDFNKIIADVFALDEEDNYTSPFDMFILGYSLGNAAFPTFHPSFFATGGDSNNTQYSDADYDAFSAAFESAQTTEEAFEAMWEMERLIARDKPHVPLFDTGILEFHNNRVQYPFTDTLSGLQFLEGSQALVTAR